MSEINKNNLEEFFSNSMEQFSEVPSNFVWEGISDRLDEDERRPIFWWRKFLMMVIPFITITLVAIYFIGDNNDQTKKSRQLLTQNISNAKEASMQNFQVEDANNTKTDKDDKSATSTKLTLTNLNSTSPAATNLLTAHNEKQNQKTTNTNIESSKNQIADNYLNPRNEFYLDHEKLTTKANEPNNDLGSSSHMAVERNSNHRKTNSVDTESIQTTINKEISISQSSEVKNLNFPTLIANSVLNHNRSIEVPPIIIINDEHKSKYRIGINGRFANTFVSDNNMFNGNESYGIRQEYNLTDKLAITNAIHFNIQHYDIEPKSDPIKPVIVQRYTSRSFDDSGGVQKIESNSEYVDFSLGLKYGLEQRILGFNAFVNPSFVGQVYLPQTFSFLDFESNLRYRENKRIVMYLGSANINFGIEKELNKHLHLQVSIWGEQSFIPIGLQREKIKTLGISTSLLFGN